ncbi:hypothetical protein Pint_21681 [Pistacia integerrima]|uniref:Uncharacterized protein n=1 Tax=Pistacia integerrima TaxID=434235 RepID=A0ACC0XCK7_9ROSI|nr:hypothetical protein Pint_21681 [Pistacia integerrima]
MQRGYALPKITKLAIQHNHLISDFDFVLFHLYFSVFQWLLQLNDLCFIWYTAL